MVAQAVVDFKFPDGDGGEDGDDGDDGDDDNFKFPDGDDGDDGDFKFPDEDHQLSVPAPWLICWINFLPIEHPYENDQHGEDHGKLSGWTFKISHWTKYTISHQYQYQYH